MEFKVNTTVSNEEVIYLGRPEEVIMYKYYDLNGSEINEGKEIIKIARGEFVKITEKKVVYHFEVTGDYTTTQFTLYIDDKKVDNIGEITGITEAANNTLLLDVCTGQG